MPKYQGKSAFIKYWKQEKKRLYEKKEKSSTMPDFTGFPARLFLWF